MAQAKAATVGYSMFNADLAFVAFVLLLTVAALLFPGGPGTPRRIRVHL